jgi:hypothetical protein
MPCRILALTGRRANNGARPRSSSIKMKIKPKQFVPKPTRRRGALRVPPPRRVGRGAAVCGVRGLACDEIANHGPFMNLEPCSMYDFGAAAAGLCARHVTQYANYTLKGMNS